MLRRLSLFALLLAALAGCGSPAATTAPVATSQAAPAASSDTAVPAAAPVAFPVTVTHAAGDLSLPKAAAKIVACSEEALDFLITLGVQPAGYCSDRVQGAASGAAYELPNFFPGDKVGRPVFVGSAANPSVELIASLKPDLVISTDYTESNEQISQAAPTYVISTEAAGYWRETLRDLGRLTDRLAQAEAFLSEYDSAVATFAAQTAPVAKQSPQVLLVYSFGAAEGTMLLGNDWYGSRPFAQLGFTVLEPAGASFANGVAPISPETIAQADADIIFVLRPLLADGARPSYPIDTLLAARKDAKVIYQVFGSTRASTAPWTDRFVLEEVAGLLSAK